MNHLSQAPLNWRAESSVCSSMRLSAGVTVIYSHCLLIRDTRLWLLIKSVEIRSYNI